MVRSLNRSFFDCFRTHTVESNDMFMLGPSPSGAEKQPKFASDGKRKQDQRTRRSLRRLAKALISRTTKVTKIRRKKSGKKLNNSCSSMYNDVLSKVEQNTQSTNNTISSPSSTISSMPLCSSSGSSAISTPSTRREEYLEYKPIKQPQYRNFLNGKNRDLNFVLCLFLICLLILTCWGKACAIFCTSTLFVLISSRVKRVNLRHGQTRSQQMDLKKHKKAVIMEGLLSRNRNHMYSY